MRKTSRKIGLYLMMLLMAAFVVVPISDTLACALESHATVSAAQDVASDPDGKAGHEVPAAGCSHGHCHHSNASLPLEAVSPPPQVVSAAWDAFTDINAYAVVLDGLTRPPQG
ncbi:hypothetical protein [uncultured Stenotrophomonas sp.]|jgi:hypothetical protein|uniref:hypothetical protein n=1 Tax=uncultured Stenotrophomonas sp. TaxID=165438 RepID=UPI0025CEFD32|nr:hypothetical protein [uncultured Stenotrophomonas sp.]